MKKVALTAYILVIASLAVIPFIEKETGNHSLYSSWWFIFLWLLLAIAGTLLLFRKKDSILPLKLAIHGSLLLIFLGAMISNFCKKEGSIHLRQGEWMSEYHDIETDKIYLLPFKIKLDTCSIEYYAGTDAPADYFSKVSVEGKNSYEVLISMNKILKMEGYRFYQSKFDKDGKGVLLWVSYNHVAIWVTYSGFFLLTLSMLFLLFYSNGPFRKLLRYPFLKVAGSILLFLFLLLPDSQAAKTFSKKDASQFSDVLILSNNRIMPLQTFALNFTRKLTGENSYKGYSPEQVLLGWIFYPEEWQYEPMIKVEGQKLEKMFAGKEYVCFVDFFDKWGNYKLYNSGKGNIISAEKAMRETDERVQLIAMLQSGSILKIFPYRQKENLKWRTPVDSLPLSVNETEKIYIRNSLLMIYNAANKGNKEEVALLIKSIKQYQKKQGGELLPSGKKIKAELLYNRIHFLEILYKINLALGVLALFLFVFKIKSEAVYLKKLRWIFILVGGILFLFLTGGILLRAFISGHFPLSNGYETMLFVSWCLLLITLIFSYKLSVIVPFGFLLSGFTMLVASIGEFNSQITPLVPILDSPLLTIHVSLLMFSYALLAFSFLIAVYAIIKYLIHHRQKSYLAMREIVQFGLQTRLILYPAVILLAIGIMTGSVWANISWGNYWSWDPKEVWALITLMVYSLGLHSRTFGILRKPVAFHLFIIMAFSTVLMTYFGVSSLFGGMHSYGN